MREIKFRAWDGLSKKIYPVTAIYPNPHKIHCRISDGVTDKVAIEPILMQYTGLKDKNGVEIYSGDYLKQEGLEVEVKWGEFEAGFIFKDESGSLMNVTKNNSNMWEVTGNKYENSI